MNYKKIYILTALLFSTLCLQTSFAQELTLYTGLFSESYYQDDEKITKAEFKELLKRDEGIWAQWRRAATFEAVGSATSFASGALFGFGLGRELNDKGSNAGYYIGSAGAFVVSLIFVEISQKNKRRAVLGYNENLERKTTFKLAPSREGIGLAVRF